MCKQGVPETALCEMVQSTITDVNKVTASNQHALPVLSYLMPTQRWPISELQQIDREVRKVTVENGGTHPAGSSVLLYSPRAVGGRGMKSVETAYKVTKIKTALKIQGSTYPTVKLVKNWDENSARSKGRHSTLEDAVKYAREFGLDLDLTKPNATCQVVSTGDEIIDNKIPDALKNAMKLTHYNRRCWTKSGMERSPLLDGRIKT